MAQITSGLRAILSKSAVYDAFTQILGGNHGTSSIVNDYVKPWAGARVLDIGCGTGRILDYLPAVDYYGFDASAEYIADAQRRYANRGHFNCCLVEQHALEGHEPFDIAMAIGVLHHLDDDQCCDLFQTAFAALKPGGRLVTVDGTFVDGQSRVARRLVSWDRGQNIRRPDAYVDLASSVFPSVSVAVRHDLLRLPYTHALLSCTR